jgi:hypothetical protein
VGRGLVPNNEIKLPDSLQLAKNPDITFSPVFSPVMPEVKVPEIKVEVLPTTVTVAPGITHTPITNEIKIQNDTPVVEVMVQVPWRPLAFLVLIQTAIIATVAITLIAYTVGFD